MDKEREGKLVVSLIEKAITDSGLSKNKFAIALGVPKASLYSWLNGTYTPNAAVLIKIAEMIGKEVAFV